jgi:hypothetical protein
MIDKEVYKKFMDIYEFEGYVPQILKFKETAPGEIVSYKKDENTTAFTVNESLVLNDKELTIGRTEKGTMVFPPEFIIEGKGDTFEKAVRDFIKQDTALCMKLMTTACQDNIIPILDLNFIQHTLKDLLEKLQNLVEKVKLLSDKFIIGSDMLGSFYKSLSAFDYEDIDDALKQTGIYGSVWGINVYVDPNLENCIFCVADPKSLGARFIRDVTYSDNSILVCGGMCILNPQAVSCAHE